MNNWCYVSVGPSPKNCLEQLNVRFACLLIDGRIVQGRPLPEEKDEPGLAALPRLIFHFNRRDFGILRP